MSQHVSQWGSDLKPFVQSIEKEDIPLIRPKIHNIIKSTHDVFLLEELEHQEKQANKSFVTRGHAK